MTIELNKAAGHPALPHKRGYLRFAVGVCGFPRSGSSMTMRMLEAAGIGPAAGAAPVSYELPSLDHVNRLARGDLEGRAVKLLDTVQWMALRGDVEWRFIWNDRSPAEQARSQVKFASHFVPGLPLAADAARRIARSYENDRPMLLARYRRLGPTLVLSYEGTLASPGMAAAEIARFVGRPFDIEAAAAVVTRRSPKCAPDLAFELDRAVTDEEPVRG